MRKISVTGLGYVGAPVAAAFAAGGFAVTAFDLDERRVAELAAGRDRTGEVPPGLFARDNVRLTAAPADLARADLHIVTVPTPITADRRPDLGPLVSASRNIGTILKRGDIVVYESTVYPGATEETCVPVLEQASGLKLGVDFAVGYSPERINPGDRDHRFQSIPKVVSGSDEATLAIVAETYGAVVTAGIHRAPSIRVAEAAKVIENAQRDLNIAFMNELAMVFDRLGINTRDVLEAASTKWNFLRFHPGLVGGHCIGVDSYYLTAKAEASGYLPEVTLAGRRTNEQMGRFVAQKLLKNLAGSSRPLTDLRVAVLGVTFKENVPDIRNSKVADVLDELRQFGVSPLVHDPIADPEETRRTMQIDLVPWSALTGLDAMILAVPHRDYLELDAKAFYGVVSPGAAVFDVRGVLRGRPADRPIRLIEL
jgi:UDP-N-acetyl-D-galactosamine dehydrogenase